MKNKASYSLLLGAFLLLAGCSKEVNQEDLVSAAVALKIEQWKVSQLALCKQEVYTKAEQYVDSILVVTSLDSKLDTIPKPLKPEKPTKPIFKDKPDSVVVKPIYKEE
jgi:PBP1b-binding outer membrane lipoprotein LpoB